jgi:heavy metal-(Cd/Co/Hg/Pb/Zn)-translocating P-type ATPase
MKKKLLQILISLFLFIFALMFKSENIIINNIIFIISYTIVGSKIVFKAFKNILRGKVFDENFLMTIATIGAFLIGEFPEAVAVMLFYQVGELFQDYAVNKSRKSITELMNIKPDYANVKRNDEIIKTDPNKVEIGETIVVKPGEKIPLDGIVIKGNTLIDTSSLTGESLPKMIKEKDIVLSGCINKDGVIEIITTKNFSESTVSKILDLVENASNKKSKSESFITKFAKYYTPIVVIVALILAITPPLLNYGLFSDWIYRALTFLVVSCPCALVISVPLSFFGGIGRASKAGILIKGSTYLESLSQAEIIVFDKTGTLTKGEFCVEKINSKNMSEEKLLFYAAHAETYSNHPVSLSLKESYKNKIDNKIVSNVQEIPGMGVSAQINNEIILVGNDKFMNRYSIRFDETNEVGTILYIAINNIYEGYILISDKIKDDSTKAIHSLRNSGIKSIVMLTGDKKEIANKVAESLEIPQVYAELLPNDKVDRIEFLLTKTSTNGKVVFVGDGINDAPVLALSDIGIAMGGLGSDAAIEASDIVIMTDEPSKIVEAINISKKTIKIVKQNIWFAISIKIGVLILSAFGISTMWEAVFADVGVSILAILNSLRLLKK